MYYIDSFLNKITMYRLLFQGLAIVAIATIALSYLGYVAQEGTALLISLGILFVVAYLTDIFFAKVLGVTRNIESVFITVLILFFLLVPAIQISDAVTLVIGAFLAISSKYLFVVGKRHIFNPAAFAAAVLSLAGTGAVVWWVGTPYLFPLVAILGLLIVRKVRRFDLFLTFVLTSIAVSVASVLSDGGSLAGLFSNIFFSGPLLFMGTIMLTEPLTAPRMKKHRIIYAFIVGVLFSIPFDLGPLYVSPALALIIGNLYTFFVSNTQRLTLIFKEKIQLAPTLFEFVFEPSEALTFSAGQYLEWTLGHTKPDARGNRRYFTIASAPGEETIRLGVRISTPSSSFKSALINLAPGDSISATALGGEFILPKDLQTKIVCIAGGIGITPYISMLRDMERKGEKRNMTILYFAASDADFAYLDVLNRASEHGVTILPLVGRITKEILQPHLSDTDSLVYISGPDGLVRTTKDIVRDIGVPASRVKTDYFPGL